MATQTQKGKSFEYVCLKSIYDALVNNQEVIIEENNAFEVAKDFYNTLDAKTRDKMVLGASAAVRIIFK